MSRFFRKVACKCGNKNPAVSSHQGSMSFHVCCEACKTCGPNSSSDPWGNEPYVAVANDAIALWNAERNSPSQQQTNVIPLKPEMVQ